MAKENSVHVFVCYGTLSFDAAVRIASVSPVCDEERCFFLLFRADLSRIPGGVRIFQAPALEGLSQWAKPFVVARWFSEELGRLKSEGLAAIVAYIPHPFELPGNHFLFFEPQVERVELLPDGLVNYLDRSIVPEPFLKKLRYSLRVFLRVLAAAVVGLRYRSLWRGHLTQVEGGHYKCSWTDSEKGLVTRGEEVRQLPRRRARAVAEAPNPLQVGRTLLILDQEISHIVSSELELKMRERLRSEVGSCGAGRILYKGHPRGTNRCEDWRAKGFEIEDRTGLGLAEELIEDLDVEVLAGFYSTPLVLGAEQVPFRISVLPDVREAGVIQKSFVSQLYEMLEASGAEVIQV